MTTGERIRRAGKASRLSKWALGVLVAAIALPSLAPKAAYASTAADYTIWSPSTPPYSYWSFNDSSATEVGVKFRTDIAGTVKGIRFYKGPGNTGTHVGNLWTSSGTLLASVTFAGETASGWQQMNFASPVGIVPNTTYVASYFAPVGHYAAVQQYFSSSGVDNPPLHALASGFDGGNGVFTYSGSSAFPSSSASASNYWVDVVLTTSVTTPPAVTAISPGAGATNAPLNPQVSATFSETVQPNTISFTLRDAAGTLIPATLTYELYAPSPPLRTATLQPSSVLNPATTYTATLSGATDSSGNAMTAPLSWSFTTTTTASPPPGTGGSWSADTNWPVVTLHSAVLNTGNLLAWDVENPYTEGSVWNPSTGAFTPTGTATSSLWCSGMVQMADGRVLEAGGGIQNSPSTKAVYIYDPASNTWTRAADMLLPRWYPGLLRLNDGRILAMSGTISEGVSWADTPEVYDPASNTWTLLSGVNTSDVHEDLYANTYLLPNGKVFVFAASTGFTRILDVAARTWTPGPTTTIKNGSSIMYRPGKFLVTGGGPAYNGSSYSPAAVLDMTAPTPAWRPIASMAFARSYHSLVVLPNGKVLAAGGGTTVSATPDSSVGVLTPELWDPSTEAWTTLAPMRDPRMNHSTITLLPDGTVLGSGGGHEGSQFSYYTGEVYSPPYLFQGARPTIASAPSSAGYGATIAVQTPDVASIGSVSLMGLSAQTHHYDASSFFVNLSFTQTPGGLNVVMPASAYLAPPGFYMLSLVNSNGVPSTARIVQLVGTDTSPPVVAGATPAAGATGVPTGVAPTATFSKPVQPATIAFTLKDAANNSVTGTTSYNSAMNTATFRPSSALNAGTTYTATVNGAKDLAGKAMTAPLSWSFTIQTPPTNCPCTIWTSATTPANPSSGDTSSVELGVKVQSDFNGYVTGIRFYKGAGNTGTHIGNLWSSSGTLLATATFGVETASGWQQVTFPNPVAVTGNTTYVASYFAPAGNYPFDTGYFSTAGKDSPPLHALQAGVDGPDGVYKYNNTSTFPNNFNSVANANYWVDLVFVTSLPPDTTPPTVINTNPAAGATGVGPSVAPAATFSKAVQATTITFTLKDAANTPVVGTISYNSATNTATFTPAAALAYSTTYTATVSGAKDLAGNVMTTPVSWSFTTISCPCNIWSNATVPSVPSSGDTTPVELGVKFRSDSNGFLCNLRFYKGAGNTGTHIGNVWSNAGTLLTTATFAGETATGWQQVNFPNPPAITANTTYVASYFAPAGNYSFDTGYFTSSGKDSPPLHALQAGVDGPNGLYKYTNTSAFPTNFNNATNPNYWVDVGFCTSLPPDTTPPTVTGTTPTAGATGVGPNIAPTATFSKAVQPTTITFTLKDAANAAVAGTVSYNAATFTATFTPGAPLNSSTIYTAAVSGAKDIAGNVMSAPVSWSFTTVACPCTIWTSATVPSVASSGDTSSLELGVKVRTDFNGFITGIRFYKGAGNSGTHIANLWSSTGTLLATATFTGETATGWQQVTFPSAVSVTGNTTYIASYFAPAGNYSYDTQYFANSGKDAPPLHALQSGIDGPNGVFRYGSTSGFPTGSANNTNYWVDLVFVTSLPPDTTPPTVTSTTPIAGSTGVGSGVGPTATFSKAVQAATISFTMKDAANTPVTGTVSYNTATFTATFTPTVPLNYSTTYTATVSGAKDQSGNVMTAPVTWSFTTITCPCTIWSSATVPLVTSSGDTGAVEVGVKFRSDSNGFITGVRFYKGVGNNGTHIGNLWSSTGTLLATATFTGEAASGWQQVNFSTKVAITANTTYVASYYAPVGNYSYDSQYFANSGKDSAPLHALQSGVDGPNGLFRYGSTSSFPTSSSNNTNYWVDVVLTTS